MLLVEDNSWQLLLILKYKLQWRTALFFLPFYINPWSQCAVSKFGRFKRRLPLLPTSKKFSLQLALSFLFPLAPLSKHHSYIALFFEGHDLSFSYPCRRSLLAVRWSLCFSPSIYGMETPMSSTNLRTFFVYLHCFFGRFLKDVGGGKNMRKEWYAH